MINAQTRITLAFTAGVCVGGGIGYLIADHHIKKLAAKDLEAVQDMFRRIRAEETQVPVDSEAWPWSPETGHEAEANVPEADRYQTPAESIAAEEEIVRLGYATKDQIKRTISLDPNYVSPDTNPNDDSDVEELEWEQEDNPENAIDADLVEEVENVRTISRNPMHEPDPDDVTSWDRNPDLPYVITEAEYRIDRLEFEKDNLTYYAGDDTLAEENGNYIPDKNGTAGNRNLAECFGMGSGDDRLLYIRNERVMADFEINLNDGKYTREVLDVEDDDEVPPKRVIKKMRRGE